MAMSTYQTYLMLGTGSGTITYSKLIDIKDYPDLFAAPEAIDVTTLSDAFRHYIPGIRDAGGSVPFTANYDKSNFSTLKGYSGTEKELGLFFGSTSGSEGKITFKGYIEVSKNGGGVNEASDMTINIFPTSDLAFAAG